ncbi:MAG: hypothetical protein ACKOFI_00530, partial [Phycisphaerales bacterium]
LQQSSVLEEQMRQDLERICRDGFLAIQCVEVPNDINVAAGGPLLNPQLPATELLRCDQVVFFTAGTEISARWAGPGDLVTSGGGQQHHHGHQQLDDGEGAAHQRSLTVA